MRTPYGRPEEIFWGLSRKITPSGTIYKSPAGVPEASRIANRSRLQVTMPGLQSRAASGMEPSDVHLAIASVCSTSVQSTPQELATDMVLGINCPWRVIYKQPNTKMHFWKATI